MSRVADFLRTADAGTLVGEGLRWWVAELRSLLPPILAQGLAAPSAWLALEFSGNSVLLYRFDDAAAHRLGSADLIEADLATCPREIAAALDGGIPADRVAVLLSPRQILRQQFDLPLTSLRHLRALMIHELDRRQPLPAAEIHFDCRILERDAGNRRMRVELAVAKRETVDRALSVATAWGLSPSVVGVWEAGRWPFNLQAGRRRRWKPRWSPTHALLALALLLVTVGAGVAMLRHDHYAERLRTAVAAAKEEAAATERILHQVEVTDQQLAFLNNKRHDGGIAPWFETLAKLLPDGSWLTAAERHGATVRVRGYSHQGGALVDLLARSPLLANVRLANPLTPGPIIGIERFDISFDLRPRGSP